MQKNEEELNQLAYKLYLDFYNVNPTPMIATYSMFLDLPTSYPRFLKKAKIELRKDKIQKLKKNILDNQ